ncbi:MAG TPA: MarR family transcriptional regulator [Trebonia sp.]|jgi:DNA-binding MarR family transcriptional regulator|nr:MarR family transcriptional regulator [Trebonia sp.]
MPAEHGTPPDLALAGDTAAGDTVIAAIESALHSLARRLRQARLHDYICQLAGDGVDQAGIAVLYALREESALPGGQASVRITDAAAQLGIDAPAVTRKAQQLEKLGLVSRSRDDLDARATRLRLTPEGQRVVTQVLLARHQWLTTLLADWPEDDCRDLARLIRRLAGDVDQHARDLDR